MKKTKITMGMIGVVLVMMMGMVWEVKAQGNVPQGECIVKLWPQPSEQRNGSGAYLTINPSSFSILFSSSISSPSLSSLLSRITSRYLSLLSTPNSPSSPPHRPYPHSSTSSSTSNINNNNRASMDSMELEQLVIEVDEGELEKSLTALWPNETYSLSVPFSSSASLTVHSIPSLVWGLETFSQLLLYNNFSLLSRCGEYQEGYIIPQVPWQISDQPRFRWRGLLVDTSRHFLPIPTLHSIIDGISYNKMNRLHLHLTDAQSFPILLNPPLDRMAMEGAYSPDQTYSPSDLLSLQDYARERGVILIAEVDSPGHSYSWGYSHPHLIVCPDAQPDWNVYCNEPPCGQLDPTNPLTYSLLSSLFSQLSSIFNSSSPYLHLGYDEVNYSCWLSSPHILHYMQSHSLSNSSLLQHYLSSQLSSIPPSITPIFWEEVWDQNLTLPSSSIIQVWNSIRTYHDILLNSSHPVLLSNHNAWYLDCGYGSWVSVGPSWCKYNNWQEIYLNEPFLGLGDLTEDQLERAYGGEVCIWGEQNDENNIMTNIFPRVSAAAERLWSSRDVVNTWAALPRLLSQRNRLVARHVPSAPLQPQWCQYNPHHCDLPY